MRRVWVVCCAAAWAVGCAGESGEPEEPAAQTALTGASDEVRHAQHFELSRRDGYTVVRTFGEVIEPLLCRLDAAAKRNW